MEKRSSSQSENHSAPQLCGFYSISAGRPFLNDLAHYLLNQTDHDPFALADISVYLPTRRAVRTLQTILVQNSPCGVTLLPALKPLGTPDEDDFLYTDILHDDVEDFPPAMSPMERRLVLARLIAAGYEPLSGQDNQVGALRAAMELEGLLDSFYTEEIPLEAIEKLTPQDEMLATHWQVSRQFLSTITTVWPNYLKDRGLMDPTARRIAMIRQITRQWQDKPPTCPVIIAGSTGSTPAVAAMMQYVASLHQGLVILPGLDQHMDENSWGSIDDAHPQSGLKALLNTLDLNREKIKHFPVPKKSAPFDSEANHAPGTYHHIERHHLLSLALRPAEKTDDWLSILKELDDKRLQQALHGLTLLEAPDEEVEATLIAIAIRQTLEVPEATAMLVSPDRDLTRRVEEKLKRWAIDADDSGGTPFVHSRRGLFLQRVANWLASPGDPVALLALLRHPLFKPHDINTDDFETATNLIDQACRGTSPGIGLQAIRTRLKHLATHNALNTALLLMEKLEAQTASWAEYCANNETPDFGALLKEHLAIAKSLCTDPQIEHASSTLWQDEDGIAGAQLMDMLIDCAGLVSSPAIHEYPSLFRQLIAGATVRRQRAAHPRVVILGPLEARLQSADHVLLAGLNEGSWPGDASVDGFLSRPMRLQVGLPSPERRTGLSAHDFAQYASMPNVTITRALRSANTPTTPSRWVVRLKTILTGNGLLPEIDGSSLALARARLLDKPAHRKSIPPPAPRPPAAARPSRLAVTRVETWLRDPYALFARYILKLRKLDRFHEPFGRREIGMLIHTAFERYADTQKHNMASMIKIINELIDHYALPPHARALWQMPLQRAGEWFVHWHEARSQEGHPAIIEGQGKIQLNVDHCAFTLEARADRIDLIHDDGEQGAAVYDFKTGTPPSLKQIATFSPQLPLTGLIVEQGGFTNLTASPRRLAYVKSFNQRGRTNTSIDPANCLTDQQALDSVRNAETALRALIKAFSETKTPYLSQPRPEYMNDYGDYDHLARRQEWAQEHDDGSGNQGNG